MNVVNDVTIAGAGAAASFLAMRALQLDLQPTILRVSLPAVVGIEIVPASAWRLLDALGLGDVLAGLGAGLGDGLTRRLPDGTIDVRDGRSLHVERLRLREALLREAERRGARICEIDRLPPLDPEVYAVDATGQRAAWSRPVVRQGREWADIFFADETVIPPGTSTLALLGREWAYLASDQTSATVGVVGRSASVSGLLDRKILRALELVDGAPFRHVGRRAAFVQWATKPIVGRRLAIGDAAVHHSPIGGRGLAFALGSAFAAAAVLATWRDDPPAASAARSYYESYVAAEAHRHVTFLRNEQPSLATSQELPEQVRWVRSSMEGAYVVKGRVTPGEVVTLANGEPARWLGHLDLIRLREIVMAERSTASIIAHLSEQGFCIADSQSTLSWALERGLIVPAERTRAEP
ncbi:hypothetical protein [Bradyrhizobium sp. RT4b]|uniref:hypothetical protein n=1 Tax=Bradyrhizobium sp. RT4b TaxID=3156379 RepID=UPI0033913D8E